MDYEPLVANRIREGRALVSELVADPTIDLVVAFWVKPSGVGYWRFFIGSKALTRMKFGDAIYRISLSLDRIDRQATMGLHELKLISPSDPIALDAITFRDQRISDEPMILRGSQLGQLEVDEAFIYPKIVGTLSRQDVIQRVAALLGREGRLESASITLKDGRSFEAVPTSIRRGAPGDVQIVLHDSVNHTDQTVSADDVLRIR